jgi:hypothetical protein
MCRSCNNKMFSSLASNYLNFTHDRRKSMKIENVMGTTWMTTTQIASFYAIATPWQKNWNALNRTNLFLNPIQLSSNRTVGKKRLLKLQIIYRFTS